MSLLRLPNAAVRALSFPTSHDDVSNAVPSTSRSQCSFNIGRKRKTAPHASYYRLKHRQCLRRLNTSFSRHRVTPSSIVDVAMYVHGILYNIFSKLVATYKKSKANVDFSSLPHLMFENITQTSTETLNACLRYLNEPFIRRQPQACIVPRLGEQVERLYMLTTQYPNEILLAKCDCLVEKVSCRCSIKNKGKTL